MAAGISKGKRGF